MNPRQPLWLPPGSVRAILALLLVLVTCWMALTGKVTPEAFLALTTGVAAFYFGTKATSS